MRRSRTDREGDGTALQITPLTLKILLLLHRHRYAPSHWIHHFVGGNQQILKWKLRKLWVRPHCLLRRPEQQRQSENANYKHTVYELDTNGYKLLIERGLISSIPKLNNAIYAHEFLNAIADMSFHIGVAAYPSLSLLTWQDLSQHPNVPEQTRESDNPFSIPLSGFIQVSKDKQRPRTLEPDGQPFIIKRELPDNTQRILPILKEIDRNTEPGFTKESRASWKHKLQKYQEFYTNKIYHSHYGFPHFFLLIVTTNERRKDNLLKLIKDMIREPHFIGITAEPDHAYQPRFPLPSGNFLTREYERVGPPLSLLRELDLT